MTRCFRCGKLANCLEIKQKDIWYYMCDDCILDLTDNVKEVIFYWPGGSKVMRIVE